MGGSLHVLVRADRVRWRTAHLVALGTARGSWHVPTLPTSQTWLTCRPNTFPPTTDMATFSTRRQPFYKRIDGVTHVWPSRLNHSMPGTGKSIKPTSTNKVKSPSPTLTDNVWFIIIHWILKYKASVGSCIYILSVGRVQFGQRKWYE